MTSSCSGRWSPGPTGSASSRRPGSRRRAPGCCTTLRRSAPRRAVTVPLGAAWRRTYRLRDRRRTGPPRRALRLDGRPALGTAFVALAAAGGRGGSARFVLAGALRRPRSARPLAWAALTMAPGRHPDRHRQRDLGPDRRPGRPAARRGAIGPAGGAVPGRVPRQSAVSRSRCRASSPSTSIPTSG